VSSTRTPTGDARAHSRFAPSSLTRFIACPASVALCESLPPQPQVTSRWAAEGTVAHAVAEEFLEAIARNEPAPVAVGDKRMLAGHEVIIDAEMMDAVHVYLDHLDNMLMPEDDAPPGTTINMHWEKVVRLDAVVGKEARCYGHLDAMVLSDNGMTMHIIDFKYGRGIEVAVNDNAQLMAYALGAYHTLLDDKQRERVERIVLHVVQPRVPGRPAVQTAQYTAMDVLLWGETVLRPTIQRIRDEPTENLPFCVGSHCRFCPALAHCPAQAANALAMAKEAFVQIPIPPAALDAMRLREILDHADVVTNWIEGVKAEAHTRMERGDSIPGWKLVAKRGTRQWVGDSLETERQMFAMGLKRSQIFTDPELRSPAQVEKALPKDKRTQLAKLWQSVSSGTTLAPVADPRPAVALGPQSAFRALPDEQ
jgi:hypothetical protein